MVSVIGSAAAPCLPPCCWGDANRRGSVPAVGVRSAIRCPVSSLALAGWGVTNPTPDTKPVSKENHRGQERIDRSPGRTQTEERHHQRLRSLLCSCPNTLPRSVNSGETRDTSPVATEGRQGLVVFCCRRSIRRPVVPWEFRGSMTSARESSASCWSSWRCGSGSTRSGWKAGARMTTGRRWRSRMGRPLPFNEFKGPVRAGDLHNTHGRHSCSWRLPSGQVDWQSCSLRGRERKEGRQSAAPSPINAANTSGPGQSLPAESGAAREKPTRLIHRSTLLLLEPSRELC
jgi:hypothetical protein